MEEEEEEGAQAQVVGERKLNVNPKQTAKTQAPFTSSQWALMEAMLAGLTFVESASRQGRRYALATQQAGHGLGPPQIYVFAALLAFQYPLE